MLFQGHAGPANLLSTPPDLLRANLCKATSGCPEPDFVCGCFAGLVNDAEAARAEQLLRDIFPAAKVSAVPDYRAAFMACPPGADVCVVAGTGSVVCSRHGAEWQKSGGRGYLLGNPGSAFRFGQDALIECLEHPGQASEHTKTLLLKEFGSLEEPAIIAKLYKSSSPAAQLAKLAPIIARDEIEGREYASRSMNTQLLALAEQAARHVRAHVPNASQLGLAGGVWNLSPRFVEAFRGHVAELLPEEPPCIVRIAKPPVHGAAALAREMA